MTFKKRSFPIRVMDAWNSLERRKVVELERKRKNLS